MKDSKEMGMESDIKSRMQPLKEQLKEMINQLNKVFETQLFIVVCRGLWEQMGQVNVSLEYYHLLLYGDAKQKGIYQAEIVWCATGIM
jgi:hypothetical protein